MGRQPSPSIVAAAQNRCRAVALGALMV